MKQKIKQTKKLFGGDNSILICFCLAAAVIAVYWPVYKFSFINHYDDGVYVTGNKNIQSGFNFKNLQWSFTAGHASNWHPITWLSHTLDYQLFKNRAGGHHLINLLFHLANTILLFYFFKKVTSALWPSFFVAAAFALHPLHVESVAWVAERKDVLSTMFWLLTMLAYVNYAKSLKIKWYLSAFVLYVLGLMSKPMLVTLPFVLLLLDYWPLERKFGRRLVFEKIPFFVCSIASCIVTFLVQEYSGAMTSGELFSLKIRVSNTFVSYVIYIIKMIWPARLAVLYPHPGRSLSMAMVFGSVFILLFLSVIFIYFGRRQKFLTVGWLWFIGTMIPVIGLVQVGPQALADRYTYMPLTGLFIIMAFSAKEFISKRNRILFSVVLLIIWSFISSGQLSYWKNDGTLLANALRQTENNHIIMGNYVSWLTETGKFNEAVEQSYELLKIKPDSFQAHCNLGSLLLRMGKLNQAEEEFRIALKYKPDLEQVYFNLALVERKKDNLAQAVDYYYEALKIKPDYVDAYICLAITFGEMNKIDEAVETYRAALRIEPNNEIAKRNLNSLLKKYEKE